MPHTCEWPSSDENDPEPCGLPAHNRIESPDGVFRWYCIRHFDFIAGIYRMLSGSDFENLSKVAKEIVKKNNL